MLKGEESSELVCDVSLGYVNVVLCGSSCDAAYAFTRKVQGCGIFVFTRG